MERRPLRPQQPSARRRARCEPTILVELTSCRTASSQLRWQVTREVLRQRLALLPPGHPSSPIRPDSVGDSGILQPSVRSGDHGQNADRDSKSCLTDPVMPPAAGDPLRILGTAADTHPDELQAALDAARSAGGEVVLRPGQLGYSPGLGGKAGQLSFDKYGSYGHYFTRCRISMMIRLPGFPGWGYWLDGGVNLANSERQAYSVEISYAVCSGQPDAAYQLQKLMERRLSELGGHHVLNLLIARCAPAKFHRGTPTQDNRLPAVSYGTLEIPGRHSVCGCWADGVVAVTTHRPLRENCLRSGIAERKGTSHGS